MLSFGQFHSVKRKAGAKQECKSKASLGTNGNQQNPTNPCIGDTFSTHYSVQLAQRSDHTDHRIASAEPPASICTPPHLLMYPS
jgi:hypothetical protein